MLVQGDRMRSERDVDVAQDLVGPDEVAAELPNALWIRPVRRLSVCGRESADEPRTTACGLLRLEDPERG